MRVTVLGTGIMGAGVAGSLLRGGHQVTVWNRDPAKTDRLRAAGATVADSPAAAVAGADAVLTVLFDADSVLSVMTEALPGWNPSAVWAQLATIGIDGTARVAALAERHGLSLVDAPMLGTKAPAENGQLVMLISGEPALIERLSPVWEAIGSRTVRVGERVGDASALKLAVERLGRVDHRADRPVAGDGRARSGWTRSCSWTRSAAAGPTCPTPTPRAPP